MPPQPVSKYGGIPFSDGPVSKYGGVPVGSGPVTPPPPSAPIPPGLMRLPGETVDDFRRSNNFDENPLQTTPHAPFNQGGLDELGAIPFLGMFGKASAGIEPIWQSVKNAALGTVSGTVAAGAARTGVSGALKKLGVPSKASDIGGGLAAIVAGMWGYNAAAHVPQFLRETNNPNPWTFFQWMAKRGTPVENRSLPSVGLPPKLPAPNPKPISPWEGRSTPGGVMPPAPGSVVPEDPFAGRSMPGGMMPPSPGVRGPDLSVSQPGGMMPPPVGARIPEITSSIPGGKMPPPPQTGTANPWEGRSIPGGRIPPPVQQSSPVSPWEGRSAPGGRMPPSAGVRAPTPETPTVATPETTIKPIEGEATMGPKSDLAPIDKFEMNRMLHARAQESSLPGSPAGFNGHPNISAAAKENFGVDSASKMNVQQMRMLYDYLEKNGRFPVKGELVRP